MENLTTPWPIPESEEARLAELWSLDIMNTPHEEPFDSAVEIAAALFDTPLAALGFVGDDQQWFKAGVGLPVTSNKRAESLCNYTIFTRRTIAVEDLTQDGRFVDHPLVTGEPKLRFYAGAPLITHTGECVGTLCVLDFHPRLVSPERLRLLERMAQNLIEALESRRMIRNMVDILSA